MICEGKNLNTLQKQFHSRAVSFDSFKRIKEEDLKRIREMIEKRRSFERKNTYYEQNRGLNNYINTLQYLLNPTISLELKTFDEKILFLILSCDPDFETLKLFISSDITPSSDIDNEENEIKKQRLKKQRNQELNAYTTEVRKKIGFYDNKLLKYESLLQRGLMKTEGFISNVKVQALKPLLDRARLIENIDIISEANIERLKSVAERWSTEAKDPKDLNSLAYNLLNRYKYLHIYTVEEQLIIFILIADPSLDLLKIFEEESNYNVMQERAIQEIGFYNKDLIKLEQLYHDKFEPERKLSAWTK